MPQTARFDGPMSVEKLSCEDWPRWDDKDIGVNREGNLPQRFQLHPHSSRGGASESFFVQFQPKGEHHPDLVHHQTRSRREIQPTADGWAFQVSNKKGDGGTPYFEVRSNDAQSYGRCRRRQSMELEQEIDGSEEWGGMSEGQDLIVFTEDADQSLLLLICIQNPQRGQFRLRQIDYAPPEHTDPPRPLFQRVECDTHFYLWHADAMLIYGWPQLRQHKPILLK